MWVGIASQTKDAEFFVKLEDLEKLIGKLKKDQKREGCDLGTWRNG